MVRLKAERLRRGWSQTVIAFHAGMSPSDISRIETCQMRPYPAQAKKLASVLGIDVDALLDDDTGPVPEPQNARWIEHWNKLGSS